MLKINENWTFELLPPPAVTAYTTTWNCLRGQYPVRESILSFAWCDKIVVLDGGSDDGTFEVLMELKKELGDKLSIIESPIPLDMPGKDGYQKAMAYAMVDTPLAIQFDIDEICRGSVDKWKNILRELPENVDILNLPVLEPYGASMFIRTNKEHTPWKWRVYRVKPEIVHGIPKQDQVEVDGVKFSRGGSDGCFPIHVVTEEMYPSKMNKVAAEMTKIKAAGDKDAYERYLQNIVDKDEPFILHLGHVNLRAKIKHYLSSWHNWWCMLYNKDANNPKNNLYFPGVSVSDVTNEMIEEKVRALIESTPVVPVNLYGECGESGCRVNHKQEQMGAQPA